MIKTWFVWWIFWRFICLFIFCNSLWCNHNQHLQFMYFIFYSFYYSFCTQCIVSYFTYLHKRQHLLPLLLYHIITHKLNQLFSYKPSVRMTSAVLGAEDMVCPSASHLEATTVKCRTYLNASCKHGWWLCEQLSGTSFHRTVQPLCVRWRQASQCHFS